MTALLVLIGCVEYGLSHNKGEPGLSDDTALTDSAPGGDSAPDTAAVPGDPNDEDPPAAACAEVDLAWAWSATAAFSGPADPTDAQGRPFWDPEAEMQLSAISLPDHEIPVGGERAYRAGFTLDALPGAILLSLQSDDGLWLWLNGEPIGHWGGDYQEEGCVNENARCVQTVQVPDLDITPWLVRGENVLAARVSNPVANAWFEILPRCEETRP